MEEMKIELFIPGELKEEPILCDMIKNFNIILKIIEYWLLTRNQSQAQINFFQANG